VAKKPIEIDCEEVWRQISNYLDDEVDSGLRNTMSSHFKDCTHCSAVLDGARNVVKLVGDGRAFEIPSGVRQTFYKKLNDYLATRQPSSADARPPRGDEPQHRRSPIRWCSRG
jgi:hypothetical protein